MKIYNLTKLAAVVLALNASLFSVVKAETTVITSCNTDTYLHTVASCLGAVITAKGNHSVDIYYSIAPESAQLFNAKFQVISRSNNNQVLWGDQIESVNYMNKTHTLRLYTSDLELRPKVTQTTGVGKAVIILQQNY